VHFMNRAEVPVGDYRPDVGGKDVLDAGCGPSWYADWLASNGARVVAIDCSLHMVSLADDRLGGRASRDARRCEQSANSASQRDV
jgi:2-polyprenyl-3-methyl-5-hydroxy-6-metoxy-1,4-benzoquinol methylase